MSILSNERERRAAENLARQKGVNFMSVGTQIDVLRLVKRSQQEEETAAERKMAEIAAKDVVIAQKYGGPENWQEIYVGPAEEHRRLLQTMKANPQLAACQAQAAVSAELNQEMKAKEGRQATLDDQANESLNLINKAMQKLRPPNPDHPLYKMVKEEGRLERELNPQPRKPARGDWREKLTDSPHWQDALEWFRMTPAEKAVAEAEIADAVNTEIGPAAQALANQADWDAIDPKI